MTLTVAHYTKSYKFRVNHQHKTTRTNKKPHATNILKKKSRSHVCTLDTGVCFVYTVYTV